MRVGIEIEVESNTTNITQASRMLHNDYSQWVVERDGSLRGGNMGFEVKSARPTELIELPAAMTQLYPILAGSTGTWRAAVHVHVDMLGMYWNKRALCLAMAYCCDLPIFERYSPERVESNFSVPLSHKSYGVFECIRMMANHSTTERYGKYSSVNISRINDLGTMEFRHMRTPECGSNVEDVRMALGLIQDYAESCAAIAECALGTRLGSQVTCGNELASAFLQMVEHFDVYNYGRSWLRPTALAIGEVLPVLADLKAYDMTTLDFGSLIQVVPNDQPIVNMDYRGRRINAEGISAALNRLYEERRRQRMAVENGDEPDWNLEEIFDDIDHDGGEE